MLNLKNTLLCLFVLIFGANLINLNTYISIHFPHLTIYHSQFTISLIYYFLLIIIFIGSLVYGSLNIKANFYLNAVNQLQNINYSQEPKVNNCELKNNEILAIKKTTKFIALSFDDGPDEKITVEVLRILKKFNAKGNFFIIGEKAEKYGDLLREIYKEKHTIGNHTYTHNKMFGFYKTSKMIQEIEKTEKIIEKFTNEQRLTIENNGSKQQQQNNTKLFRPPFGVTNPALKRAVEKLNYKVIGWNNRSLDTTIKNKTKVVERVTKKMKANDIILLHDNLPNTPYILEKILEFMKDKGFETALII